MLFLLKLLFLPIWLPLKIIGELIGHSGEAHLDPVTCQRCAELAAGVVARATGSR